ncbi:hypothetical protein QIH01_17255 [Brevibacillus brevis]|uniref:hypothetical protein n=1 Tax=Brevibacillus brevis TaxID=1393 RepID=UPI000AD5C125|nr:hypothetical protein [Brevibacillus brevis]WGV57246.1 hypothetical protein QIH01_17255 [Brevibacillus brevis]
MLKPAAFAQLTGRKNLGEVRLIPLDDWKAKVEKTRDDWRGSTVLLTGPNRYSNAHY